MVPLRRATVAVCPFGSRRSASAIIVHPGCSHHHLNNMRSRIRTQTDRLKTFVGYCIFTGRASNQPLRNKQSFVNCRASATSISPVPTTKSNSNCLSNFSATFKFPTDSSFIYRSLPHSPSCPLPYPTVLLTFVSSICCSFCSSAFVISSLQAWLLVEFAEDIWENR